MADSPLTVEMQQFVAEKIQGISSLPNHQNHKSSTWVVRTQKNGGEVVEFVKGFLKKLDSEKYSNVSITVKELSEKTHELPNFEGDQENMKYYLISIKTPRIGTSTRSILFLIFLGCRAENKKISRLLVPQPNRRSVQVHKRSSINFSISVFW